jgi:hypothetical protein
MALQQAITQQNGYDANYWRLVEVDIDWENGRAQVRLKGYKDQQTREDNPQQGAMDQKRYSIRGELFQKFFDVPDLSQISEWDSTVDYSTGVLVLYGDYVWEAQEAVASGGSAPSKSNSSWSVNTNLQLNRDLVYNYIKKSVDEFSGATDV